MGSGPYHGLKKGGGGGGGELADILAINNIVYHYIVISAQSNIKLKSVTAVAYKIHVTIKHVHYYYKFRLLF